MTSNHATRCRACLSVFNAHTRNGLRVLGRLPRAVRDGACDRGVAHGKRDRCGELHSGAPELAIHRARRRTARRRGRSDGDGRARSRCSIVLLVARKLNRRWGCRHAAMLQPIHVRAIWGTQAGGQNIYTDRLCLNEIVARQAGDWAAVCRIGASDLQGIRNRLACCVRPSQWRIV